VSEEARVEPVDVAVAVSARAVAVVGSATRRVDSALHPVAELFLRPPWVPPPLRPGRWLEAINREGEARREALRAEISRRLDVLVPVVLDEVLRRAHLTDVLLRYVDLDRAVSAVDLDAAAARLDVSMVLDRIDLTAVVLERVDLDAIVRRVLDRIDLTAVVLERVDLDAIVQRVLDRIDLTAVVLERVDLDALIQAFLDRIDLTAVVLRRVDLDAVIQAALDRIDLVPLAVEVIEGVDLPEIIRESTGSMASDTVQGVRMQGIVADEAVGRALDRLLLRRAHRSTRAPAASGELSSGQAPQPARNNRAR
jgi:hypothetical protein